MVFKCKMCGGDIVATEGAVLGTCDSCGITSTLPKATDEKFVNLFNRANHFRRLNEFDRALGAYESILTEDNTNAEAHWCVALCRYGIEYVEDPKTGERVPTCHRANYDPIVKDADYLAALEHAEDGYARELYETEAKKINEIQKNILAISSREEPFDVFICYKETTDGGSRTKDSVIAQDIHDALTKEGLRVFFARITLENMLGAQYEPYIFGALNTAKVMLVIGTQKEHFNAVWVRNEWSRFLALMKKDRAKTIVPCYRDMDAYDLPEELSMYQSQDMGKIGFAQDLIRGIKKITDAGKKKEAPATATTSQGANATVDSLIKRVFMFLEDGDFTQAAQYAEKVLDADPENAKAYIGKLLVELQLKCEDDLRSLEQDLKKHDLFQKAMRFAHTDYKRILTEYAEQASKNAHRCRRLDLAREKANDFATFSEVVKVLEEFPDDEEADSIMAHMKKIISAFADTAINGDSIPQKYTYAQKLEVLGELFNANDYEAKLFEQAEYLTERAIEQAKQYAQEATAFNQKPISAAINLIAPLAEWNKTAANTFSELNERQQALRKQALKIVARKAKKKALGIGAVAVVVAAVVFWNTPPVRYVVADIQFKLGRYEQAAEAFSNLGDFGDCNKRYKQARDWESYGEDYKEAIRLYKAGEYYHAYTLFRTMTGNVWDTSDTGFRDSRKKRDEAISEMHRIEDEGTALYDAGEYAKAAELLESLHDYSRGGSWFSPAGRANSARWHLAMEELKNLKNAKMLSSGDSYNSGYSTIAALMENGTVTAFGKNIFGQLDVSKWQDIIAVSVGYYYTFGLRADGTVAATDIVLDPSVDWQDADATSARAADSIAGLSEWQDIIAISARGETIVGLRANGTVVSSDNNVHGFDDWHDIVAISAHPRKGLVVGLRADGTVVATDGFGRDAADWHGIITAIPAGDNSIIGLRADGTVVATNEYASQVEEWYDIVAISANSGYDIVGLRGDGTVLAVGHTVIDNRLAVVGYALSVDLNDWQGLVEFYAIGDYAVGLKEDGTIVMAQLDID